MVLRKKLRLVHGPTPLERVASLDALVGAELWVKRDDMTAGPEAGNKIRKLEYLLCDALERGADTVITCGGVQSNHARATAILARKLGLAPVLVLRTADGRAPTAAWHGNLMLDALVDADVRFVTPAEYGDRDRVLAAIADELRRAGRRPYVIPEGGSNGLGALGYVDAMGEVRAQLDAPDLADRAPRHFEAVAHACGSAGTAAGIGIGALLHDVASEALAFAVCDDRAYFEARIAQIQRDAFTLLPESDRASAPLRIFDEWKGPAYGVPSAEQVLFIRDVARVSGLILDPVYSGKALFGVARMTNKPKNILFIHTGGLPGLLAEPEVFASRS